MYINSLEGWGFLISLIKKGSLGINLSYNNISLIPENFCSNVDNLKALNLEDEMGLPLHLPMPRINPKSN